MENNVKKEKKKIFKKPSKRTLCTILGVVFSISIGTLIGYLVAVEVSPKGNDYSNLNENTLTDDVSKLYQDYIDKPKDILSYSPNNLANIAIYKYSQQSYTESIITGSANAMGVTQKTYGRSYKNKDTAFNESISESSFVKVAKRFYGNGDEVEIYNGNIEKNDQGISASYQDKEEFTSESYKDTWGKSFKEPVIYIISEKTTLETSKVTKEEDGNYLISLDLDPQTSVVNYVKQMVQMSGLDEAPEFLDVHLEFTIDSSLNLIELNVKETYYVWMVVKSKTEATLKEEYKVLDKESKIPSIDEKIYYWGNLWNRFINKLCYGLER